jgi:hypothetical protein
MKILKAKKRRFINWKWVMVWIALIILLLALLMTLLNNLHMADAFVRYQHDTNDHIQSLTDQLNSVQVENTNLHTANESLAQQVQELKIKINGMEVATTPAEPKVVNVPSDLETPTPLIKPPSVAPIVISTLVTMFNGLRMLVPVLP